MARCHNSTAAFATRWSHSQRSQAPRQSQTPEKIGVKLHRSIGGQPERGGDKIGVNSCYMLYYIISILYDIILYYIMLLYIITCDAAEPSSNTQESNSLSPLTCEYAAFAHQPSTRATKATKHRGPARHAQGWQSLSNTATGTRRRRWRWWRRRRWWRWWRWGKEGGNDDDDDGDDERRREEAVDGGDGGKGAEGEHGEGSGRLGMEYIILDDMILYYMILYYIL